MTNGNDHSINITGNVSGQVASGQNVHQTQQTGESRKSELELALDRLENLLRQHASELPEAERATRDLESLRRELQHPDPDPETIQHTTSRLTRRAAGVAAVTEAVNQVTTLLGLS